MEIWLQALIIVCIALLNVAAHWFPWWVLRGAVNDRGRLRRVLAYGYGVGTIWAGMATYTAVVVQDDIEIGPWAFMVMLTLVMAGAGIGTLIAYGVDGAGELQARLGDIDDYEQTV